MKIVDIEGFEVRGIAVRTSNAREMTAEGLIPGQWKAAARLFDPESARIALYTEYESDVHGEYTFAIGTRNGPAEGGAAIRVPAGRYAVFTSEPGPVGKVVFETWRQIWADASLERSYIADFEIYDERAADPANAVVEIYVGVK